MLTYTRKQADKATNSKHVRDEDNLICILTDEYKGAFKEMAGSKIMRSHFIQQLKGQK